MVKGILVNRKSDDAFFKSQFKMEHADLVAEMQTVENLPTHERLQLARLRRTQQLKVARQKEKEWLKLQRAKGNFNGFNGASNLSTTHHFRTNGVGSSSSNSSNSKARGHISFENSVVLLEAASRNDMQEVAALLEHGITPDAANEDGLTALHQCCIDNNVEMLKLLLEFGANVDAQDSDKWTPLHAAATCGHLELVRILIDHGANLLAVNTDGNMPYDLCDDENTLDYIEAEMSKRGVTQELIDDTRSSTEKLMLRDLMEVMRSGGGSVADLEEPDVHGATPLHIAAANGYVRVVEFLLEMHVNVDALDKDMWTPVHAAACWGHLEVLEMLAQCGADLNVKNKDDETPSDICEDPEIRERIEQLKTEQESKRLAEAQRRRVRRSQSNNTRAQSVRRTSLRDKTLTTKKDAVEEARLRLQAQEVYTVSDGAAIMPSLNPNGGDDYHHNGEVTSTSNDLNVIAATIKSSSSSSSTSTDWLISKGPNLNNHHSNSSNNNNNTLNTNHNNNTNDKKSYQQQASLGGGSGGGGGILIPHSLSVDGVDSATATHSYIPRRPPDGRENDELQAAAYPAYRGGGGEHQRSTSATAVIVSDRNVTTTAAAAAESLQLQSSKEATNGKINVQVTVLVDTTSTHNHEQLLQQHQHLQNHSQAQQQQLQQHNMLQSQYDTNFAGATLANLKKQRSLSRTNVLNCENGSVLGAATANNQHHHHSNNNNNNNNSTNTNNNNNSLDSSAGGLSTVLSSQPIIGSGGGGGGGAMLMDYNGSGINTSSTSMAPSISSGDNSTMQYAAMNKFSGVTGDVVSDSTSSRRCCTIM